MSSSLRPSEVNLDLFKESNSQLVAATIFTELVLKWSGVWSTITVSVQHMVHTVYQMKAKHFEKLR